MFTPEFVVVYSWLLAVVRLNLDARMVQNQDFAI